MQLSIILPVFSETAALVQTVEVIKSIVPAQSLKEIIIIVSPRSSQESMETCQNLATQNASIRYYVQQNNPGIGWAFREAFAKVQGDYVLMMASDGETDPRAIPSMIEKAQATGCDIVTANRWIAGGGFEGYSALKKFLNYFFQKIMSLMYGGTIGDYTYAYRLYKSETLQGHVWQETKHPFLLESLLRPLKKGATVQQVPVVWRSRTEGKSQNSFWQNFIYFRTAAKIRFER